MYRKIKIYLMDVIEDVARLSGSELSWHFDLIFFQSSESNSVIPNLALDRPPFIVVDYPEANPEIIRRLKLAHSGAYIIGRTNTEVEGDLVSIISSGVDFILPAGASPRTIFSRMAKTNISKEEDSMLTIRLKNIELDPIGMSVRIDGDRVKLSEIEFKIVNLFMKNPNKVIKRDFIVKEVWGKSLDSDRTKHRTLDAHLVSIRKKLKPSGSSLDSVYGVGYILKAKLV